MKRAFTILPALFAASIVIAQDKQTGSPVNELQLESQAERQEGVTEDDTQWQQLEYFQKHPLNLNNADADDLKQLHLLTDLQITNFLRYKKMLGPLLSVYELQAVPGWDVLTIKQLLPFITVSNEKMIIENLGKRLSGGEYSALFRYSEAINRSDEYKKTMSTYAGNAGAMLFRYKYNYKNLLQYGITGDKDAGESFFKGAQRTGFDFYSFHLFARKLGIIQSLAIGDFTVHFGQGLIQWQGLAFKKSADVLNVKRQGPVLQPYNSAGEYNFHRGVGITLRKKNIECTLFGSLRRLTANIIADSLLQHEPYISSINTSGYHRSILEIEDRNNVQLQTAGGSLKLLNSKGHIGINAVEYAWSKPMKPSREPYDLYGMDGNRFGNYSLDYSYTLRNMHVFGEVATDNQFNRAMIHGVLTSLHPAVDMAIVYRNISSRYQSMFSNAFTENSLPVNENGWYAGISIRPIHGVRLDAYADIFRFPWLKFQANAPSGGHEYLVQVTLNPNKNAEIYSRFRNETKSVNMSDSGSAAIKPLPDVSKLNWRTQISYRVNRSTVLRSRVEAVWYANNIPQMKETGFLFFTDVHVKPAFKPFSFNGRLQYVETDGYNARIYAWENTVPYNYYIPAFYDKALRYVISVNYRLTNHLLAQQKNNFNCLLSLSFGQSINPSKTTVRLQNSANDENQEMDIRLQIIFATR